MSEGVTRVLLTSDTVGGVLCHSLELARGLSALGVEVVLATMGGALDHASRQKLADVPGLVLHESNFALEWMDDAFDEVDRAGQWLLELGERHRPDVVHLAGYAHGALGFRRPVLVAAHSCVLSWWEAVFKEAAPPRYAEYARRVRAGIRAAHAVVAPTRAMLGALVRHHGAHRSGHVIPNGVTPTAFRPARKEPFFLAAGRLWDRAKNLALLVEAARDAPWPLHVAGDLTLDGSRRSESPPGGAKWLGKLTQPELADVMGQASVFVHPARYEPFGLAPLEAALAGCALVLGDLESLREVWGDAAIYVDPDDAPLLARTLSRLARDPDLRLTLALKARSRAREFGAGRMSASYLTLYRKLAGEASLHAGSRHS